MAVSSRSSRRPRAATAARASWASMAVTGPTSANLSCSRVMRRCARARRSCGSQDAQEGLADAGRRALVVGKQVISRARPRVPHAAGEAEKLGAALGQAIHRAIADDPQARFQPAEEAVAAGERRMVLRGQMAMLEQQAERLRRVRRSDLRIIRAVGELEELDRELHVDEPSAPQLGIVPAGSFGGPLALDSLAHG